MPRTKHFALAAAIVTAVGCTSPPLPPGQPVAPAVESHAYSPDLKPFLESYFSTWSAGDMDGYKAHFHRSAVVTLLDRGEVVLSMPRDEFVAFQAEAVARASMTEHMTSFSADEDERAASVTANWLLEKGGKKTTGVDRFTLIRDAEGKWQIIGLLFYVDR